MKIGIYTNLTKDFEGIYTKKVCDSIVFFSDTNIDLILSEDLSCLNIKAKYLPNVQLFSNCDIVIVLGGDGTILRIAELAASNNTKILALNLGSRGFLTEIHPDDLQHIFKDILSNNYCVDKRIMLQVKMNEHIFVGLNDVVVARGSARAGGFCVKINDFLVDKYTSDGVIVSTPTGSTAYNLSSGGPIVAPDVDALVITPIAAHSLHTRPIVTNSSNIIKINVKNIPTKALLNVDGLDICHVDENDVVEITTSKKYLQFIRTNTYNYYDRFLTKLLNWIII